MDDSGPMVTNTLVNISGHPTPYSPIRVLLLPWAAPGTQRQCLHPPVSVLGFPQHSCAAGWHILEMPQGLTNKGYKVSGPAFLSLQELSPLCFSEAPREIKSETHRGDLLINHTCLAFVICLTLPLGPDFLESPLN
jgi:hypothetical protein